MWHGLQGWALVQETFDDGNFEELDALFLEDNLFFSCGRSFNIPFFSLSIMNLQSLFVKLSSYILKMLFYKFVNKLEGLVGIDLFFHFPPPFPDSKRRKGPLYPI